MSAISEFTLEAKAGGIVSNKAQQKVKSIEVTVTGDLTFDAQRAAVMVGSDFPGARLSGQVLAKALLDNLPAGKYIASVTSDGVYYERVYSAYANSDRKVA